MAFAFLAYPGFEELDLVGPWEMATLWHALGSGPTCLTVAEAGVAIAGAKGLRILPDHTLADCPAFDLLLVPGGLAALDETRNERLIGFVRERARTCRHVLSVCTGAFILHAAGLLEGKRATTHWRFLPRLRALPGVEVVEERFTRDGTIWTAAGVSAGIDLLLAFIAAITGADEAGLVQRASEYYPDGVVHGSAHRVAALPAYLRERRVR